MQKMLAALLSLTTTVQAKHLRHKHLQSEDPASQILQNIGALVFYHVNTLDTSEANQPVFPIIYDQWSQQTVMAASNFGEGKIIVAGAKLLNAHPYYTRQIDFTTLVANSINYVSKTANCAVTPGLECKVLLAGSDQTGFFVQKAKNGNFAISIQVAQSLDSDDLNQFDLVYLNQRLPLSDGAIAKLQDYVRNGGGLLVEYTERFNFDYNNNANRVLAPTGIKVTPNLRVVTTYYSDESSIVYNKLAYAAKVLPENPIYKQQYDSLLRIVNGVSTLNSGYKFSTILKDESSFQFLNKGDDILAVGAFYGSGKLVVIGSDDYVTSAPSTKDSSRTKTLMANIKSWFGKASPRVGGLFGLANCNGIPNTSYNVITDAAEITTNNYDIICLSSMADIPRNLNAVKTAVVAFVKAGGNLFVASSSGKWIAKNGNTDFKRAYPVNVILRQFGIVLQQWESTRSTVMIVKPSSNADKVKAFLGGELLDVLNGQAADFYSNVASIRSVITKGPAFLFESICGVELYNRIMDTFEASPYNPQKVVEKCNSQPWSTVNQIMRQLCDYAPSEIVRALPSSLNSYPGRASASAKAVKTVSVPLDYPNKIVYSGMYVNPGEPFTITFEDGSLWQDFDPRTFTIKINNNDVLTDKDCDCARPPNINYEFTLTQKTFVSPIGGFLYFELPRQNFGTGAVKLRIDAYQGNYFNENLHTVEQSKQLLSHESPFIIVQCDTLGIIGRGGSTLRKSIRPEPLCKYWNDVMTDISTFGFPLHPWQKQVFLMDVNIEVGFMHAGNPIMGYESEVSRLLMERHLLEGEEERLNYVYYHQLGHQHQDRKWTEPKSLEVTNLIYAVYLSNVFAGLPLQKLWNEASLAPGYFDYETSFDDNSVFLDWYVVLMDSFGIDFYKKVQNMYNEKGRDVANSRELYNQMCRIFSDVTGLDMYSYFELAKMPVDADCKDYVKGRPIWHHPKHPFLTDYEE